MLTLDLQRWTALCNRLGVTDAADRFTSLSRSYSDPRRYYHTTEHIAECLAVFDESPAIAAVPDEVEFAIWLHDVIYQPLHNDNEERSARQAIAWLPVAAPTIAERVRGLILATRHDAAPSNEDEALIQDVDLHILGADPDRFERYETGIRSEYARVPGIVFRKRRREILAEFLRRKHLFNTPWFRSRFEGRARANLERSLSRL